MTGWSRHWSAPGSPLPGSTAAIRLRHPDGRSTTVPVHPGKDVPKGTLRSVLEDAGMTVDEFLKYL